MADTKISALPAVAAEADGDEFACNQAGVTKKETRAQIVSTITAALGTHVGVTAAGVHGSATATGANTLVHRDAAGDADATAFNAAAGAAGTPSHTFTADPNTGHYNYAADELGVATGGAHRAHWNTTGAVILNNAAASTFMTGPGVTIQQGAFDDEAVAIKSTDVAHGMTALADTDTYATMRKYDPVAGGVLLAGLKDADGGNYGAMMLEGYLGENVSTNKTAATGRAIVEVRGYIKSGASIGDTNADGNVFGVRTRRGGADMTLLLVDEDADLHVFNDIVVAGLVDGVDVAAHVAAAVIDHPNDSVTDVKLRNSAATSVIGRAGAGVGDPADIVAGVNDRLLAQTAGTVAFQQLTVGMVPGGIITATEIANRTRTFFAPCVGGWNATAGSAIVRSPLAGWTLADNATCDGLGSFIVPDDFVAGMTVTPVVIPGLSGNLRSSHIANYGQCGEVYNVNSDNVALGTIAVTVNENNCIQQLALGAEAIGDIVNLGFTRAGADVLDTIGTSVAFTGWIVEYTADS